MAEAGKSRRDGGTLRRKAEQGRVPEGGYQVIWGPVRNVGVREEAGTKPGEEGSVLVLGLDATQRTPLRHWCRSFQMPSCPGLCDTNLCMHLQASHGIKVAEPGK